MRIEIREVRNCKNGAFGNFLLRSYKSALITISLKLNDSVAEYGATLLHELLHLWLALLRLKGFRVANKKEHNFIYDVEKHVLKVAKKHLRRASK